jgi:3-phosphoshikimate 1-carboxyvinyltransferase
MLAALAAQTGTSTINGFLASDDCINTLNAVRALGASVDMTGTKVVIRGVGGVFKAASGTLDMGNSGTGMRLMAGLLAGQPFVSEMTGDASLRSRPMKRIKEPLELMGAKVELLGANGCAPVRIHGGGLRGINYRLPVASAQVKSCVLLAGLFADGETTVVEPEPTRDHTERMFKAMGLNVEVNGLNISVKGHGRNGPQIRSGSWLVPADFSSAAFWIGAAACREGCEVFLPNVGLNPRRTAFLDVLKRMGADVECRMENSEWEPTGTVVVRGRKLKGVDVGGAEIPNLIDELPMLAVVGALAGGKTVIRDAAELRVKESDRIATVCAGLAKLGVSVEEKRDGMIISGAAKIRGGVDVDSLGDHRIAMGMAMLALSADSPVRVLNVSCIATSYPNFWEHMSHLTGEHA